jgi:DNA-binding transcriptional regulator YdaS (Cro superfamily)
MSEPLPVTPQDYDVWHQATPQHFLSLLRRLGIEGAVIARQIGASRAAVSQWYTGKRNVSPRYIPALQAWTKHALEQAAARTKAADNHPDDGLQWFSASELGLIWRDWKLEVLYSSGTLRKALLASYRGLGEWLARDPLTDDDRESIHLVLENIGLKVDLLLEQQRRVHTHQEAQDAAR